ncbi:MAG: glycosyltransferase family 4 protein [Bacteroidota bacterium]
MKNILLLAQTPPPFHGQAVMQAYLVNATWDWCEKRHIRLAYSESIDDVGRFSLLKVLRLFRVVLDVWRQRLNGPIDVLYYPPAGPQRVPFYRDILTLLLVRWCAKRLVLHFHAGAFDQLQQMISPLLRRIAVYVYGRADTAIVLLPSLQNEVQWIVPKRIEVVPNGIEDVSSRVSRQAATGIPRILFVGAISEAKGIFDALAACRILRDQGEVFLFTVVGDFANDTVRIRVHDFVRNQELDGHVVFAGVRSGNDKWQEYADADIFCFPSYETEGQPVVLIEAMQFSLPIVATRWRALPDIVRDGEEGILVPLREPLALSEALGRLLSDGQLRKRLGFAGRNRFVTDFHLQKHLHGLERVFHTVAAE